MNYNLLKDLLVHLEAFEQEEQHQTLEGFTIYLNKKLSIEPKEEMKLHQFADENLNDMSQKGYGIENHITYLLGMMWKYAKHYIKEGFKDLPIKTVDDFSFLASLSEVDSMTKTELITYNITEIPSGMEVIKRLIKFGYIESFNDPNDRRAKRLKITPQGQGVMFAAIGKLQNIAQIVTGDLDAKERLALLAALEKLNDFHKIIHQNDWKSDLGTVAEKYVLVG